MDNQHQPGSLRHRQVDTEHLLKDLLLAGPTSSQAQPDIVMESSRGSSVVKQAQPATQEKRREFLLLVLEAEEKRREAIESKSSILIASNAILLSGVIGLGLPLLSPGNSFALIGKIPLTVVSLAAIIVSILLCVQVIYPIGYKRLSNMMDWETKSAIDQDLMFFRRISALKKEDYLQKIDTVTERQILEQLASRVHDVSRLLNYRYRIMSISHRAFIVAVVAFAMLAVIKLLTG